MPLLVTGSEETDAGDCPYRLEANARVGSRLTLARPGPTLALTPLRDTVNPLALPTILIDSLV